MGGGAGDDLQLGGRGDDVVDGGDGDDLQYGGNIYSGTDTNEKVRFAEIVSVIDSGTSNQDLLDAYGVGSAPDGNDVLIGGNGDDLQFGDTVSGYSFDGIYAHIEDYREDGTFETVLANPALQLVDSSQVGGGDDHLFGEDGDFLAGGDGDDRILGDGNTDLLFGG